MAGIAQNGEETSYFQCGPSGQKENETKGHTRKKQIYKHTYGHTIIYKYRHKQRDIEGNIRNRFLSRVCFAKRIFCFRKFICCAYPTMWGKFKNFIQIIKTSVIDKIVGYSIYALIKPFTGS